MIPFDRRGKRGEQSSSVLRLAEWTFGIFRSRMHGLRGFKCFRTLPATILIDRHNRVPFLLSRAAPEGNSPTRMSPGKHPAGALDRLTNFPLLYTTILLNCQSESEEVVDVGADQKVQGE